MKKIEWKLSEKKGSEWKVTKGREVNGR